MKKKGLAVLLVLSILCSTAVFGIYAEAGRETASQYASVDLKTTENIGISASPSTLAAPGEVTINITLTNTNQIDSTGHDDDPTRSSEPTPALTPENTDEPIATTVPSPKGSYTNIVIENEYGVTFDTQDVYAGETATFSGKMDVKEDQIGTALTFRVIWYDTAALTLYSRDVQVTVARTNSAYLKVTRTLSKSHAAVGETIVITYTFANTGTLTLHDITIYDKGVAGNTPLLTPFSLVSGQSYQYNYSYVMGSESVISYPTVTFRPDGSNTTLSVTAPKQTIGLSNAQLSKEIAIGDATAEGVTLTLYLTNNGNQLLSNLRVTDELGGSVADRFSLAIGETKITTYFVANPSQARYVVFYITGSDESGTSFSDNTESIPVRPYIDPTTVGLDFNVAVASPLNSSNIISLTFTLKNTGSVDLNDIILTEEESGLILKRVDILPPSSVGYEFSVDVNAGGERELVFKLSALDPSGNPHEYDIRINAAYENHDANSPLTTPEAVNPIVKDNNLGGKLDSLLTSVGQTLTTVSIIVGGIAAVIAGVVIVLLVREKKFKVDSQTTLNTFDS